MTSLFCVIGQHIHSKTDMIPIYVDVDVDRYIQNHTHKKSTSKKIELFFIIATNFNKVSMT